MDDVEKYAVSLVAEGTLSTAQDDMAESDEAERLTEKQWRDACKLGSDMGLAVKENQASFLAWYRAVTA